MEQDKKDLLETFNKLDPQNKADILAYARVAYSAQESTKRAILAALQDEKTDGRRSA